MPAPPSPWLARARKLLASPHFVWVVVAAAILLGLPTLDAGFHGDDLQQQAFLRSYHDGQTSARWWNMFALVDGQRTRTIGLRTSGRYPWWVDPELRIVFFRPVAVLTHHLDHWLWPRRPGLMHLHSVLWHALTSALAWRCARRLLSNPATASLAALMFALSLTHTTPVSWLAHRNGLVSSAFALAVLLVHDRWRRDGWRPGAVVAPLLLLVALLSAEAGVVTVGLVLAYAVCIDVDSWRRRALTLVPYLAITAAWRIAYTQAGFGAVASGAYIDPLGDPGGFASVFPARYLWLLASSLSPPLMPTIPAWLWLSTTGAVAVAVLVYLIRDASDVARFGALAVALGCLPLVASHPGPRLLVLTSFAAALVFAELVERGLGERGQSWPLLHRAAVGLVVLVHLVVPPLVSLGLSSALDDLSPAGPAAADGEQLPNQGLSRRGLVIVHAPNYLSAEYLPVIRGLRGLEVPNFTWLLHDGPAPPQIERVDATTLELYDPRGWPAEGLSEYWRSPSRAPFEVGDRIKTLDYDAQIIGVDRRGKAVRVRFRFRARLEHPSLAWATWDAREGDFVPTSPSALGD